MEKINISSVSSIFFILVWCSLKSQVLAQQCTPDQYLENGECRVKASFTCIPNVGSAPKCIESAYCGQELPSSKYTCICRDSYEVWTDKLCYLKYNAACDGNKHDDCNEAKENLCLGGKCLCTDPNGQVADKNGQCGWKLGYKCQKGGIPCAVSTVCSNGKCICDADKGLSDNGFHECKKLHGSTCSTSDDPAGMCDTKGYLECSGGKCQCDGSHKEKEEGLGKPCVGNKNADCRTDKNCNSDLGLVCEKGKCEPSGAERFYLNFQFLLLSALLITVKYLAN